MTGRRGYGHQIELKAITELQAEGYAAHQIHLANGLFDVVAWGPQGMKFLAISGTTRTNRIAARKKTMAAISGAVLPTWVVKGLWVWEGSPETGRWAHKLTAPGDAALVAAAGGPLPQATAVATAEVARSVDTGPEVPTVAG